MHARDILPLETTVSEIADAICASKCYNCKKPAGEFRNSIAVGEYQRSGMCQDCQDKTFLNPSINTRYVNDSLTGERILGELNKNNIRHQFPSEMEWFTRNNYRD